MHINATLINLYHVCKRECWLHANGINMEHTSDIVYDGKLLHETSYADRARKYNEIDISAMFKGVNLFGKIDFYDAREKVIHEMKRSDKVETAHKWQVKFYLWMFLLNGVGDVSAIIEYPKLRQTTQIELAESDIIALERTVMDIKSLKDEENCPPVIHKPFCQSCSYYELCYIDEV
jgi:CRISPR-associated exonuclease Cas4